MKYVDQLLFVILVHYTKPIAEVRKYLDEHKNFVEDGYRRGIFLASGRGADQDPGVLVGRGASREELETLVKQDAFYRHGVADYEILQFHASRVCDELAAVG